MGLPTWLRGPRHLLALFLVVTLIPTSALVWLGLHLLEQETLLRRQRVQDWLERSADIITSSLHVELAAIYQLLGGNGPLPASAVRVRFGRSGLLEHSGAPLLFGPAAPAIDGDRFWHDAEQIEFAKGDLSAAAREYQRVAAAASAADIQAGALLRLARVRKRAGDLRGAAAIYERVANLRAGSFHGDPAELVARSARCELLATLGDTQLLQHEARLLHDDLNSGRWRVEQTTYITYASRLAQWTNTSLPSNDDRMAVATAVNALWTEYRSPSAELASRGARVFPVEQRGVLITWQRHDDALVAVVAPLDVLVEAWSVRWRPLRVTASLAAAGVPAPPLDGGESHAVRTSSATTLPWDVRVTPAEPHDSLRATDSRRWTLLAGLALLVFLIPAGGIVVARAVRKEMAVAQLQKDFVAAVSHELRTPLTTMAHMTEVLSAGRVPDESRRREYYSVLSRETDRLRRFVETLLDFGRMESGTLRYPMTLHDPVALVKHVADEFRSDHVARAHPINVAAADALPPVRANQEALGRALWNLLDNAAKYSAADTPIELEVAAVNGDVAIHVRDYGSGVPLAEQKRIFQQFVRGAAAQDAGIRGTGVGLAMARQVVAAHGGEIRVQSEPGRGSTFSIIVPAAGGS